VKNPAAKRPMKKASLAAINVVAVVASEAGGDTKKCTTLLGL
jgi:hypothetical protein